MKSLLARNHGSSEIAADFFLGKTLIEFIKGRNFRCMDCPRRVNLKKRKIKEKYKVKESKEK